MVDQQLGNKSLCNYETFIDKLKEQMDHIGDQIISILYTDIKHFKYFNDTFGYERGDELLVRMAQILTGYEKGLISGSRVVSDNIVVAGCTNDMSFDELYAYFYTKVAEMEETLRKEFSCNRIRLAVGVYFITKDNASINPKTAVSNANLARKVAKEAGRKSVVVFRQEMSEQINRELEILASVEEAIKNRELMAYYQPKIDSETGQICGAEALVRWRKNDGTFIYPDQFIPSIEKSGQIVEVDYFMYEEVFAFLRRSLDEGKKIVPISMNVSRQHLKDLDIIPYVKGLIDKYKVPTQYLEFELTETVCMEDTNMVMEFIEEFHNMGVLVSMDDFGSGYSSLNLLSELPVDVIKLDRCFLHSAVVQRKERFIISSIINMTKNLEMKSLCEGVETLQQSDFLREIGCDSQQGYFFSKPVCVEAFEELLAK